MGLPPDYDAEAAGEFWWHDPPEPDEDGCPGGWYRCAFVHSLDLYLPSFVGQTAMESPLVARDTDPLILEAVKTYKAERGRSEAHFTRTVMDGQ